MKNKKRTWTMLAGRRIINTNQLDRGCITATSIKLIALFCMTIDHIGAYGYNIPICVGYIDECRLVGRLAAPLFLYSAVESLKKTGNKKRYLRRLYVASILTGFANLIVIVAFGMALSFGNMIQTLFLVLVFCYFLEIEIDLIHREQYKKFIVLGMLIFASLFGAVCVNRLIWDETLLFRLINLAPAIKDMLRMALNSFVIDPRNMMYYEWIVILAICWYFSNSKRIQIGYYFAVCVLSLFVSGVEQFHMIFAVPIIWMYNGEYGAGLKWLFYLYYPIHCYIIALLNKMY